MSRARLGARGMSLLEVVIGIFVACVLFLPFSDLLRTGARATQYSEDYGKALGLAKGQIEQLRHGARINKVAMEELITKHAAAGGFKPFTVDGIYTVTTEVDPQFHLSELKGVSFGAGAPSGLDATLLKVKVTVAWEITGQARELSLDAYVDRTYY